MYSLRQLEAVNALSPSEKLKLQTKAAERSAELPKVPKQEKFDVEPSANNIKLEVIDEYPLNVVNKHEQPHQPLNSVKIVDDLLVLPEPPIRRVLIANQLNAGPTVAKASPKAVTASVFKAIPIATKQPFKTIGGAEHQLNIGNNSGSNGIARAPQTVTASLIQPIVAVKRDSFGKIQSTIAKPSLVPRQTVVTASLFQPRNAPATGPISPKFPSTIVNPQASRAAETMNKSFCMLSDDLSQPTCEYNIAIISICVLRPIHTHTCRERERRTCHAQIEDIDCNLCKTEHFESTKTIHPVTQTHMIQSIVKCFCSAFVTHSDMRIIEG